jgi:hypothetical protein
MFDKEAVGHKFIFLSNRVETNFLRVNGRRQKCPNLQTLTGETSCFEGGIEYYSGIPHARQSMQIAISCGERVR